MNRGLFFLTLTAALFIGPLSPTAYGSQLLDRNATAVKLAVNSHGQALVTYRVGSRVRHVLVFGAINAREPDPSVAQVHFRIDYSGGWGIYRKAIWKTFKNVCGRYTGPALAFQVTACTAPDGSNWALQSWERLMPNLGFAPWLPHQRAYELHVSHWTGELAKVDLWTDWVYSGRFHHVFGRVTYAGKPVYGFKTTKYGARLDAYGRLVYLDTYHSRYAPGWRRENSFVTHNPTGMFCYGFYQYDPSKGGYEKPRSWPAGKLRGPGNGNQYRATVEGPGVTPDVSVAVPGLPDFDPHNSGDVSYEQRMNDLLDAIVGPDKLCRHH
jgi:hypothetical protein